MNNKLGEEKRAWEQWECEPARGDSEGEETCLLASFPGLPTIQFLITCSMQKPEAGKFWKQV